MRRQLIVANLLFALIIICAVVFQSWRDRDVTLENGYQDLDNLASSLSGYTAQTIAGMEAVLYALGDRSNLPDHFDATRMSARMGGTQAVSRSTRALMLFDGDGQLLASSLDPETLDYQNRAIDALESHRSDPALGLHLGSPYIWREPGLDDEWVVNVSRAVWRDDGELASVQVGILSLDYLRDLFDTLSLGADNLVVLFNSHGVMLMRSPVVTSYLGQDYSQSPLLNHIRQLQKVGQSEFEADVFIDGLPRLAAWRQVKPSDGWLVVGHARGALLADWFSRVLFNALIGTLAIGLFVLSSVVIHWLAARVRRQELQRTTRLRLLAEKSADLSRCSRLDELLSKVTAVARELIGAHQAVTSLTADENYAQGIHAVEFSDKYAKWRDYDESPDGSGIYRLVCEHNQPLCMTQQELEKHPAWKGFGDARDRHPPMNGWLAVPIVAREGSNLGLIQLSDRYEGDFSEADINELQQLAALTSVAIENLRNRDELELALLEAKQARTEIETIFSSISDAVYALDKDWRFVLLNDRAEQLLQRSRSELLNKVVWDMFPEILGTALEDNYRRAAADGHDASFYFYYPPLKLHLDIRVFPHEGGLTVYFQDITQRLETEERLRQAQKMEAVGQLTGGVAHDFNNLLTVILGTTEFMLEDDKTLSPAVRSQLEVVHKAGERAAALTRRLLAFARKQPLDPQVVDVNALLGEFDDILRRTLGATIDIQMIRDDGVWRASVDPNELQNAILNLAINARDAMPQGGKLTIETSNTQVEGDYAENNDVAPGQYVRVAVSDSGAGMSPDVIARAFDPFFTTKSSGRGSGLGLSMVYGFARQSNGFVTIYSEPGVGTTVKLYLPRADQQPVSDPDTESSDRIVSGRGKGVILLVEDEELVRQYTKTCLEMLGYEVVACSEGDQALRELSGESRFDLLLTDVVLPGGLTGRQLAEECQRQRPELPVLYMSGYTENAIVHHGRLDPGVVLLSKPFRRVELEARVRQVLGQ